MENQKIRLFLCVPLMDESENIRAFTEVLSNQQTSCEFEAIFCVNQPHRWWNDPEKKPVCGRNQETLNFLSGTFDFPVTVIDKSTTGWDEKHYGVGWARKIAMDAAAEKASAKDIIFSMDADTYYPPDYLKQAVTQLRNNPAKPALANPYYHPVPESVDAARSILRYEIYMRHYAINMWRIGSPYRFTALGSAIAVNANAYRKVSGIAPKVAGEDFYFLQKLVKSGDILFYSPAKAYPMARFSDRVIFGTGPAMIKGAKGHWDSYPVYHPGLFDEIKGIYQGFEHFYETSEIDKNLSYIKVISPDLKWLGKLKKNSSSAKEFLKKCHTHFDGLKTLQYLKHRQKSISEKEENILSGFLLSYHPEQAKPYAGLLNQLDFKTNSVADLNNIRNLLVSIEDGILKQSY